MPREVRGATTLQAKMTVIIDGSGHLMGRLATVVAKELLNGNEVVIVRAEDVQISGSLFRNKGLFYTP